MKMRNILSLLYLTGPSLGGGFDGGPPACDDYPLSVSTQAEADFYSKCPKLVDPFFIDHNYTGPFELPNVEHLEKFSAGYLGPKLKFQDREDDAVTTISLPDLKDTNSILFGWLNNLTSASLPKLLSAGEIAIAGNPKLKKLTLPELANVSGGVYLDGSFDEINLPKLKNVGYIQVKSTGDLDCRALGKKLSSLIFHPQKYDVGVGFTCWTPYETNRYNSSDPESSTGGDSGDQSGPSGSGSEDKPSDNGSARLGCLTTLFGLTVMGIIKELVM